MLRLFMVYGDIFYLSKNAPPLTLTLILIVLEVVCKENWQFFRGAKVGSNQWLMNKMLRKLLFLKHELKRHRNKTCLGKY